VTEERDGLRMTWEGARFPLHAYAAALEAAGLAIEARRGGAARGRRLRGRVTQQAAL
jgi:hypothetical protein